MIPLMMQMGYKAKGWLGLILGQSLWHAFYDSVVDTDENFNRAMVGLMRCEKRHFLSHSSKLNAINSIFLPRQARDKQRENSKTSGKGKLKNEWRFLQGDRRSRQDRDQDKNRGKASSDGTRQCGGGRPTAGAWEPRPCRCTCLHWHCAAAAIDTGERVDTY
jgi:hypothetical protein